MSERNATSPADSALASPPPQQLKNTQSLTDNGPTRESIDTPDQHRLSLLLLVSWLAKPNDWATIGADLRQYGIVWTPDDLQRRFHAILPSPARCNTPDVALCARTALGKLRLARNSLKLSVEDVKQELRDEVAARDVQEIRGAGLMPDWWAVFLAHNFNLFPRGLPRRVDGRLNVVEVRRVLDGYNARR